jgi:hypothetical protein
LGKIRGLIVDAESGEKLEAKVQIMSPNGRLLMPKGSLEKRGPGEPFFYCNGEFEVDSSRGQVDVTVERGTEYTPHHSAVQVDKQGTKDLRIELKRWTDLPSEGWYPGNTHIHYDEKETRPYDRLAYDAKVETYNVTAVSILERWDLDYASNKFPLGVMTDYSTAHHVVDVGEENRHNDAAGRFSYGHVMFLRIRNMVEPVSRGFLVDNFNPDYPPLCFACDDAREQGGIVIWCHNGQGMEAPVAAVLGKLDGFNLFDPFWMDPEYDIWYKMMNCGLHLPASTGTDWFVCSNNRVYVQMDEAFSYDNWLEGMRKGRTFITNGPALFLEVGDEAPGGTVEFTGEKKVNVKVRWSSHYPLNKIGLIHNGELVEGKKFEAGTHDGEWETDLTVTSDGWIAARASGEARDSFNQAVYAHTSPVYVRNGRIDSTQSEGAKYFLESIDQSMDWLDNVGRYTTDEQRDNVKDLFLKGRVEFEKLV